MRWDWKAELWALEAPLSVCSVCRAERGCGLASSIEVGWSNVWFKEGTLVTAHLLSWMNLIDCWGQWMMTWAIVVALDMDLEPVWEIEFISFYDWFVVRVEGKWGKRDFTQISDLQRLICLKLPIFSYLWPTKKGHFLWFSLLSEWWWYLEMEESREKSVLVTGEMNVSHILILGCLGGIHKGKSYHLLVWNPIWQMGFLAFLTQNPWEEQGQMGFYLL